MPLWASIGLRRADRRKRTAESQRRDLLPQGWTLATPGAGIWSHSLSRSLFLPRDHGKRLAEYDGVSEFTAWLQGLTVPVAPLKMSFSTLACPDWGWHDVVHHGPRFGYQGVELRLLSRETDLLKIPDLAPSQWSARQRDLVDAGFRVCGLASSIKFDARDPVERARQLEVGARYLELGAALGVEFIRVFGDILPAEADWAARDAALRWIADGLAQLGDLSRPYGIQILLETHGDFSSTPPAKTVMALVDHPQVGLVWDTHHPWRFFEEPLAETFAALRPWVRHLHWKDSVLLSADSGKPDSEAARQAAMLMAGHRHADYVLFLGGEFPALECLHLVLDAGYDGWHSLEWEKMWHPELLGPEVALPLFPPKLNWLAATAG